MYYYISVHVPQIIFLNTLNILLAVNVADVKTFNITFINYLYFGIKMFMCSVCIPIIYFYKCVMAVYFDSLVEHSLQNTILQLKLTNC